MKLFGKILIREIGTLRNKFNHLVHERNFKSHTPNNLRINGRN